ncbi:hypothetical protein BSKO_13484 [Bryopsis sp. KO-2023]|nr:hypothetical protein BSKO_13484 [Bryopsis sp. KO-2023]
MMKFTAVVALLALGVSCVSAKCGDPNWVCCTNRATKCDSNLRCLGTSANSPGGCFHPGCGGENNKCCSNKALKNICEDGLVCKDKKCVKPTVVTPPVPATPVPATPVPATPVPATPVPATPVPATPVPATPVPGNPTIPTITVPTGLPAGQGGPLSFANIGGNAITQIASGRAGTQGAGTTFSTKLDGGAATTQGTQGAFVNGAGPGAGQTALSGAATLFPANGGVSAFEGTSQSGFLVDGAGAAATTDNAIKGAVDPTVAVGEAGSATIASGQNGAAAFNTFSVKTLDP